MNVSEFLNAMGFNFESEKHSNYFYLSNDGEEIIKKVNEVYPDKVVSNITKLDVFLYKAICKIAKIKNISVKTWLNQKGFEYQGKNYDPTLDMKKELLELYPDKNIKKFSVLNPKIYNKAAKYCYENNISLETYFERLGFKFARRVEPNYVEELMELYPDKKVEKLASRNPRLYNKIFNYCLIHNINFYKWFKNKGFEYLSKGYRKSAKQKADELKKKNKKILAILQEEYIYNVIPSLSSRNRKLYSKIYFHCKRMKQSIDSWLELNGFKRIRSNFVVQVV